MTKQSTLEGIIVPLCTPLNEHYEFDKGGMRNLVNHVIKSGVHGVFVLGSCGEYPCFDDNESREIVESVVEQTNGRVPVLANASRNSTKHALTIAEDFTSIGADYIVLMPPFYYPTMQQSDLAEHFLRIAEKTPVVLYNLPAVTTRINLDTVEDLAANGNITAMKDSSGGMDYFAQAARLIPTFQGNDYQLIDSLKSGGVGGVLGTANIIPKTIVAMYNLFREGKHAEAKLLQEKVANFMGVVYGTAKSVQAGVKQALFYLDICFPIARPPLAQIEQHEAEEIDEYLHSCGLLGHPLS